MSQCTSSHLSTTHAFLYSSHFPLHIVLLLIVQPPAFICEQNLSGVNIAFLLGDIPFYTFGRLISFSIMHRPVHVSNGTHCIVVITIIIPMALLLSLSPLKTVSSRLVSDTAPVLIRIHIAFYPLPALWLCLPMLTLALSIRSSLA